MLAEDRVELKGIGTYEIGDEIVTAGGWMRAETRDEVPETLQQCFPDHPPFEWADLG